MRVIPSRMLNRHQRGSILVLTLFVTLVLLAIGLATLWMTSSGTRVTTSVTRRQEAMTAAESGVERARAVLAAATDWDPILTGATCAATKDDPTGKGNILCDGATPLESISLVPSGTQTQAQVPTSAQLQFTLYVRNDPAETASLGAFNDEDRRVLIRSEGLGRDGISYVAVEATLILGSSGGPVVTDYSQKGVTSTGTNSGQTQIAE